MFAQSYASSETPCVGRWAALQAGLSAAQAQAMSMIVFAGFMYLVDHIARLDRDIEALTWQRDVIKIHGVFGGRNPHPNFVVGGVPCALDTSVAGGATSFPTPIDLRVFEYHALPK